MSLFSLESPTIVEKQGQRIAADDGFADALRTLRTGVIGDSSRSSVEKWDKAVLDGDRGPALRITVGFPNWFWKACTALGGAWLQAMDLISTFAPRTTVTTSIYLSFMVFLRSLSRGQKGLELPALVGVWSPTKSTVIFTTPWVPAKCRLRPRIETPAQAHIFRSLKCARPQSKGRPDLVHRIDYARRRSAYRQP